MGVINQADFESALLDHRGQFTAGSQVLWQMNRNSSSDYGSNSVEIRLADSDGERSQANMVINRNFGARGYGSGHWLIPDRHRITFTAASADQTFGTITLAVDRDEQLAADKTFPDEVGELRARPGVKLCELTKFAFDSSADSLPLLAALFHIVYIYGTERFACTDLLIEVNPRHVRFYEAMLGFTRMGDLRINDSVGAPSQLMHIEVARIGDQIRRHAGKTDCAKRTLYAHFFSKEEEAALRRRLNLFVKDEPVPVTPQYCLAEA